MIDRADATVTLTLSDNDGTFDLDSTPGVIRDPVGVGATVTTGGGGGCTVNPNARAGEIDPTLLLLAGGSWLYLRRRRRRHVV